MDPEVWTGQIFLGRWCPSACGGTRKVVEPATGAVLGVVGQAGPVDVGVATERAAAVQRSWSKLAAESRAAVLRRAASMLDTRTGDIVTWLVREAGAVPATARAEVRIAVRTCDHAAALALSPYGEVLRSSQPRLSLARRIPAGVVGVITPYNMPLALAVRSVAPALALGNAVVLKPDPRTAVGGGAVVARVFADAGLPAGLLHVLPGDADVGEAVVADPRVRVVAFTGSADAGRRVAEIAAKLLKRAVLEIGGGGVLVVLADADLERAVPTGGYASFLHQGQVCMAARRHLVHDSIYDEYITRLGAYADSLEVGDPMKRPVALGPLIDAAQRDRVHRLVSERVAAGAKLVAGGRYDGLCYRPTVLAEPASAWPGEVFGPVASVCAYRTTGEVAELVGDTALSVSVLTADVARGMALADRIPTGMVHVNDPTVDSEPQAPFGGLGGFGTGWRIGGQADLDAFTETQWLTVSATVGGWRL